MSCLAASAATDVPHHYEGQPSGQSQANCPTSVGELTPAPAPKGRRHGENGAEPLCKLTDGLGLLPGRVRLGKLAEAAVDAVPRKGEQAHEGHGEKAAADGRGLTCPPFAA